VFSPSFFNFNNSHLYDKNKAPIATSSLSQLRNANKMGSHFINMRERFANSHIYSLDPYFVYLIASWSDIKEIDDGRFINKAKAICLQRRTRRHLGLVLRNAEGEERFAAGSKSILVR
jgi:hypothetical protein